MNTQRRSFYAYLQSQRYRHGLIGRIAREAIATGRHFTTWSITEWMIAVRCGLDAEHDAVLTLVSEYRETREKVAA